MNKILEIGRLKEIKEQFGEAFYIIDSERFRENFAEIKREFSKIYPNFNIAYSYKTNYTPKFCKIINELGGYAEVVSEMELELALRVGVGHENIIWNGPIKKPDVVEEYILKGGIVNIDSLEEVKILRSIAENYKDNTLRVGIRCNFDVNDGVISRFGFDIESKDFRDVLEFVKNTINVKLVSMQCHFAKRQIDYWPARAKGMLELIDNIGIVPEKIDLGGALFGKMPDELKAQFSSEIPSYADYASVVATMFVERFGADGPELIIEPGTALVGDCMKFVGTIKTIKSIRGKYIATLLGSQKNINMSGINPPLEVVATGNEQKYYDDLDMVGFTCIEGDVLCKNYSGELAVGDTVIIGNCGSYSLVMKPPFILPNFPVLDISGNEVEIIKRAETFDDIFHTFNY